MDEIACNYKMVRAKDKSYILEKSEDGIWTHMVSTYLKQGLHYHSVCQQIFEKLPMSKAAAVELRAELLANPS